MLQEILLDAVMFFIQFLYGQPDGHTNCLSVSSERVVFGKRSWNHEEAYLCALAMSVLCYHC